MINKIKALYNFGVNCGEAIGPTFGGILTNVYSFETACKGTSFLNISFALIFAFINFKVIKEQFYSSSKDQDFMVDNVCTNILNNEVDSGRNRIRDRICYTPKHRGYSFSSLNSRRNSTNNAVLM